jgi:hypothetical protein
MTEQPDSDAVRIMEAMATGRRFLSARHAGDHDMEGAMLRDFGTDKDGQTLNVLQAIAQQALDFGEVCAELGALFNGGDAPIDLQTWLDASFFHQLDTNEHVDDDGGSEPPSPPDPNTA